MNPDLYTEHRANPNMSFETVKRTSLFADLKIQMLLTHSGVLGVTAVAVYLVGSNSLLLNICTSSSLPG